VGKLIAAFIDARGYRIILAVQIKSSYDSRPAFVKLLIKNGYSLISCDAAGFLGEYAKSHQGSFKGHGSATAS